MLKTNRDTRISILIWLEVPETRQLRVLREDLEIIVEERKYQGTFDPNDSLVDVNSTRF